MHIPLTLRALILSLLIGVASATLICPITGYLGTGEAMEGNKPEKQETQRSTAISMNAATFEIITDRVWKIPDRTDDAGTGINLALRITNRTETGMRFHRLDTIRIALTAPDGKSLQFDGGRDATRPGEFVSPLVLPGQSLVISREANLVWFKHQTLRLIGSDDFGGIWYFDGLIPGKYQVRIIHENYKSEIGGMDSIWTGMAVSNAVEVELR
jgi:hypothetical protein